ncbi:cingulin-like protein 1 [Sebastes umbrosus]|uniref:cingulin-like protein 1 n=1 Tax=Sebastes umbrosus TaxID=72105 RepID=UPI00189CA28D|nr:cingulin-like protein 1 [Sebastes umbrosus]XP_037602641.1 cingulin-like protein 1 [Sebastes umbrosus]XP_037602648.1 cingulin-like protein 1 [Sebastes umbrosus]
MESYRVTGIPNSGPQRGHIQPSRPSRPNSNGAGTYGLSIRVQGIDGHPYVVLNNQDRGPQSLMDPNSNGYVDTEGSFIENYQEYDFKGGKEAGSISPFMEYRSQKMTHPTAPQNGIADSQGKKSSSLLNFQKHPEILQPYDPQNNSLNLDASHSLPSRPLAETGNQRRSSSSKFAVPATSHARSSSLDRSKAPAQQEKKQPLSQSRSERDLSKPQSRHAQPQTRPQSQVAQPQFKPRLGNLNPPQSKPGSKSQQQPVLPAQPQPSAVPSPASEQSKTSRRSPTSMSSANSSMERTRREPDVLPLRRTDSSGPVLQSSSRSRHSSSSSNPKSPAEEQMEALYAGAINRHENRRYIPFLPGSGRDIDTGSIPGVDELIEKFDGSHHHRGRAGRRNRINPEDRKRSRSVDSAYGLRNGSSHVDGLSHQRGTSMEHVLRPSQLRLQQTAGSQDSWLTVVDGKSESRASTRGTSAPGSPQSTISKGFGAIQGYKKSLTRTSSTPFESKSEDRASSAGKVSTTSLSTSLSKPSSTTDKKSSTEADVQATPDLLKGQQELSQQTHEETAKQILFNYLKDGSADNDETTKRKVNLVFEKIQTLKSRATASSQGDHKSLDVAAQTKALQEQNKELGKEMVELKRQLEDQTTKNQADKRTVAGLKELQQELERRVEECKRLREKLAKTEVELQTTVEELFQVKMEREQHQTEIRDLQDQLSEMHDELDSAKKSAADGERDIIMVDMMQLKVEMQEVLLAKEEQEEVLRRRERELTALKGALKEEVGAHDQEVDKMREQYEKEISKLQTSLVEAKQSSAAVVREKAEVEAAKGAAEGQTGRLTQEAERLRRRAQELENEVAKLNRLIDEAKLQESRHGDRAGRVEREKKHLEESLAEIKEQEEEAARANRALTIRLEDVQRNFSKLSIEHKSMEERLQEERTQKEQFKHMKNDMEDERKLLDRTVEKLQREMNDIVVASQSSTLELQEQINIYKENNRRELTDLTRLLKDRGLELDKCLLATKTLQEELLQREDELRQCRRERDEAVLRETTLEKKVHDLEVEAEAKANSKEDKARHVKLMEDRIAQLELDLDEERQSGDQLMNRIDRGREQVEQMRNELLQERSSRQDLECDKMALERQTKDLKGRVAHLEGSHKSNKEGLVAQLEDRVHELEERLQGEERERANLQLVNRRLERKVKEMMMQGEEEQHTLQDQKDQLNLRLKALKRQMDEAEEEIDRQEHSKKKVQRDLDEQQEANEQLQSQLKALRNEIRRKTTSAPLLNTLEDDDDDDDDISTDGETYFSSSLGYKRSSSQENILSSFAL